MAVRGVYTAAEQQMMKAWDEDWRGLVGWMGETRSREIPYPIFHRVASKDLIEHFACAADYWNPLWRDDNYARNTRWGGVIAPPFYYECISHSGPRAYFLRVTPDVGVLTHLYVMTYREFFQPVRLNDSFKVFIGAPKLEDVTREDGESERVFKVSDTLLFENQRGELTSTFYRSGFTHILPKGTPHFLDDRLQFTEELAYSKEDLAAVYAHEDAEEIRGAKIRYWEDVSVGEELKLIVKGPLTPWDAVIDIQAMGVANLPVRECRKQTPGRMVVDPVTNIPHKSAESHMVRQIAELQPFDLAHYSTSLQPISVENFLGRLVTNWMGDDGFLRKIRWQRFCNVCMGDTIFGRGEVARVYVENGEYLVDIYVRIETIRGYVSTVGLVTVSLVSRDKVFTRNEPPVFEPAAMVGGKMYGTEADSYPRAPAASFKAGDRIRIKDRSDWPMPGGYKLAGKTATVYDYFVDPEGYVVAQLDEDVTGIDTRVPLGFKMNLVEKI
ncbi:FAS1-like dehydratase domain-containing protein [Burkholderia diffusa]|uniref:FAS1-like dehydratase domain-containing protein n=1 Tax=Burkholderia diffusa TaxID=488732 RepID=UPI002ABD71F6|nr:MaoC family dehydratase N-terminal domain-containing protein [Burkholderia diffusa]